jgi:hypothetical protein
MSSSLCRGACFWGYASSGHRAEGCLLCKGPGCEEEVKVKRKLEGEGIWVISFGTKKTVSQMLKPETRACPGLLSSHSSQFSLYPVSSTSCGVINIFHTPPSHPTSVLPASLTHPPDTLSSPYLLLLLFFPQRSPTILTSDHVISLRSILQVL